MHSALAGRRQKRDRTAPPASEKPIGKENEVVFTATRRAIQNAALALVIGAALPATALAQDARLSIGMSTTPTTLDPHEDSSAPNNATTRHIWDALINRGGAAENFRSEEHTSELQSLMRIS